MLSLLIIVMYIAYIESAAVLPLTYADKKIEKKLSKRIIRKQTKGQSVKDLQIVY